mgnify:CR=1 FL=1
MAAKRGPKPKSGELAQQQGNPGHRPIVTTPDAVEQIADTAPSWLKDKAAKLIWSELMPLMQSLRFVKATDHIAVGRYCTHLARFLDLNEKLRIRGDVTYTTDTLHGKMERLHPNFAAMMRTEEALVKLEDRLGLSPASRQSLMARVAGGHHDLPPSQLTDPRQPQPPQSPLGLLANIHDDALAN